MDPLWLNLLQTLGVPTSFLLMILFALWKAMGWMATHVAEPLVSQHLLFLKSVTSSMEDLAANQARCAESQTKLAGLLATLDLRLRQQEKP